MNNSQVFSPCAVGTPTSGKAFGDGVYDFAASSTIVLGRIAPPSALFSSTIIIFGPRKGAVSLPRCFLSTGGAFSGATALHEAAQVPYLN